MPPDAKIRIDDSWRKLPKTERKELLLRIGAVLEPRGFRKAEVSIIDTPDQVVGKWFAGGGLSFERFD